MRSMKTALRTTAPIGLGVVLLTGVMLLIYALIGAFRVQILYSALAGAVLSVGNFFMMALAAGNAADKAENQDVKGGQLLMQTSYVSRLVVLFLLLVAGVKLLNFDPLASVIPLLFVRPLITVHELFRKKGGTTNEC